MCGKFLVVVERLADPVEGNARDYKENAMNLRSIITLGLLVNLVLGSVVLAQPVHFPDPNLRVAIRDALNQPDGVPLNVQRMRQLTRLDVPPDSQIRDLAGLEYATNLTYLALGGNEITDLTPIAGLVKLRFLSVWGSPISDLSPITNLTELTRLYLGYCRTIADITPLANLTNLGFLQLRGNRIVDVTPLANLANLSELLLDNNRIVDATPLANLTRLESLGDS